MATYELNTEEQQVIEAMRSGQAQKPAQPAPVLAYNKADHHELAEVLAMYVYAELAWSHLIDATNADTVGLGNIINDIAEVIDTRLRQFANLDVNIEGLIRCAQAGELHRRKQAG